MSLSDCTHLQHQEVTNFVNLTVTNEPLSFRGLENSFMKKNIGVNCPLILNRHFSLLLIEKSILGTEDLHLNGIKWRLGKKLGSYVPRKLPTYPSPRKKNPFVKSETLYHKVLNFKQSINTYDTNEI